MYGVITTRHLVLKAPVIIQEFGLKTYCRCIYRTITTRRQVTFLECILKDFQNRPHTETTGTHLRRQTGAALAAEELVG
jgi:hypothetical protein